MSFSVLDPSVYLNLQALKKKKVRVTLPSNNQVIVAHGFPTEVGLGQIPNMGTVVVRPLGQGNGYEIVARLSLDRSHVRKLICLLRK